MTNDDDDDSGSRQSRKRLSEKKKRKRSDDKSRRRRREDHDDNDDGSVGGRSRSAGSTDNSSTERRPHHSKKHGKKKSKKHKKKDHRHHHHHHHHKRQKSDDRKEERRRGSEHDGNIVLFDLGPIYNRSPTNQLSSTDYYDYHKHLWLYLFRTKNLIFDELSSKETRRYFDDFCKEYNDGNLPAAYYEPKLPRQAVDECPTTRHKWGFHASKELELLQQSVYQQTEQDQQQQQQRRQISSAGEAMPAFSTGAVPIKHDDTRKQPAEDAPPTNKRPLVGPARPPPNNTVDYTDDYGSSSRAKRSRFDRAGDKEKLDFRERRLLEKSQIGERIHGAHRDNRDAVELTDDAMYGGDASSDFQRALEQQKRRSASRQDRQAARIVELKEKESQKQKDMLERLGLAKR